MGLFFASILLFIGCLITFIGTGDTGALIAVIVIGLIDSIFIFAIRKHIKEYFKWLNKGIKTGEWR
jgi:uncharacterized membrane-anchored protein